MIPANIVVFGLREYYVIFTCLYKVGSPTIEVVVISTIILDSITIMPLPAHTEMYGSFHTIK